MQKAPSRQMQDEIQRFQTMGQNLEMLAETIFRTDAFIKEKETAIKELDDCADGVVVYKQVGGILIKSEKTKVLETLKDDKTNLEMRKKSYERQQDQMKKSFEETKAKLSQKYQDQQQE
jgi:prefoldin beta subunit